MPSASPLGQDIQIPGTEIGFNDCPPEVQDRWLAISFVFQHGHVDAFTQLVEGGGAIVEDYERYMRELLDRRIEDMALTRVRDEMWEAGACKFATSRTDESVFDVSAGPLLGSDEPHTPTTFISFRLRFNHARQALVGQAFDFNYEIT